MSKRSKSREYGMILLYQWDLRQCSLQVLLDEMIEGDDDFIEKYRIFSAELAGGTIDNISSIDKKIHENSSNWTLDRMATIDRVILRMATFEMMKTDMPHKAAINEAIELAKKYSTEKSGNFVNGILDSVALSLSNKK